jgi:16S rRNA (uracil1498-N3)-methyltransferase
MHVEQVRAGETELDKQEAHHARDVLRLEAGAEIELFDDAGRSGTGVILKADGNRVVVQVNDIQEPAQRAISCVVASAVPKGNRADWMIEKLAELGVHRFIPLAAGRSVVLPEGKGKHQRWERIAIEAAKQSKSGVMKIDQLKQVSELVKSLNEIGGWYLSTRNDAQPVGQVIASTLEAKANWTQLTLLIGPEGGWTEEEIALFDRSGLTGVRMGTTILRVETAAVAAAAIVAGVLAPMMSKSGSR